MNRLTTSAAVLMFIAALLCIAAPFSSDFSNESMPLLVLFALYTVMGWMVFQNRRWAKWLSFLITLFGGIFGMAGFLGASSIPDWVTLSLWVTSWVAATCLFIVLWRDHVPVNLPTQREP